MQMVWHYDKVVKPEFPGRYVGAKHVDHQRGIPFRLQQGAALAGLGGGEERTLNSGCCPEEHGVQVSPSPGAKAPFLSRFGTAEALPRSEERRVGQGGR